MKTLLILLISLISGGFVPPERTIQDYLNNYFKRDIQIVDIIPIHSSIKLESYVDTLIHYNDVERIRLNNRSKNGYERGILTDDFYRAMVESTNDRYNEIVTVLNNIKSNKQLSKQIIHVYAVVYFTSGYESGQVIKLYLLDKDNKPIGTIGSDGNYTKNPPLTGIICKTSDDFYNRKYYYEL